MTWPSLPEQLSSALLGASSPFVSSTFEIGTSICSLWRSALRRSPQPPTRNVKEPTLLFLETGAPCADIVTAASVEFETADCGYMIRGQGTLDWGADNFPRRSLAVWAWAEASARDSWSPVGSTEGRAILINLVLRNDRQSGGLGTTLHPHRQRQGS